MRRTRNDALRWTGRGTELCERALAAIDDGGLREPSGLPGWSRAHVVSHLVGNAGALVNLTTWAATGVETPMYSSPEQRNADIEAGAALAPDDLRHRFAESTATLAGGLARLSDQVWSAAVVTAQGRTVPASEIPWMRAREVLVHAVDLGGGVAFDELPEDFLVALVDDVVARRSTMVGQPALSLEAGGHRWDVIGEGGATPVTATLSELAAYVTGRAPLGPQLPAWL